MYLYFYACCDNTSHSCPIAFQPCVVVYACLCTCEQSIFYISMMNYNIQPPSIPSVLAMYFGKISHRKNRCVILAWVSVWFSHVAHYVCYNCFCNTCSSYRPMLYHVCLSLCFETTRSHSARLNSTNARVKSAHHNNSTCVLCQNWRQWFSTLFSVKIARPFLLCIQDESLRRKVQFFEMKYTWICSAHIL